MKDKACINNFKLLTICITMCWGWLDKIIFSKQKVWILIWNKVYQTWIYKRQNPTFFFNLTYISVTIRWQLRHFSAPLSFLFSFICKKEPISNVIFLLRNISFIHVYWYACNYEKDNRAEVQKWQHFKPIYLITYLHDKFIIHI